MCVHLTAQVNLAIHFCYSLESSCCSLSFPDCGGGHRPSPLQKAPQASLIQRYSLVRPCFPLSLVVCWALEDQMVRRLVSAVTTGTRGRVLASDAV